MAEPCGAAGGGVTVQLLYCKVCTTASRGRQLYICLMLICCTLGFNQTPTVVRGWLSKARTWQSQSANAHASGASLLQARVRAIPALHAMPRWPSQSPASSRWGALLLAAGVNEAAGGRELKALHAKPGAHQGSPAGLHWQMYSCTCPAGYKCAGGTGANRGVCRLNDYIQQQAALPATLPASTCPACTHALPTET